VAAIAAATALGFTWMRIEPREEADAPQELPFPLNIFAAAAKAGVPVDFGVSDKCRIHGDSCPSSAAPDQPHPVPETV
jgi:hypothetical protein